MLIYFYNPGRGINQVTDILGCYSLKCRQSNSSAVVKYSWPFTGLKSIMDNSNAYLQANNTRETKEQELTWLTLNEGEWSELESWELETCKFTRELQFSDFSASEIHNVCSVRVRQIWVTKRHNCHIKWTSWCGHGPDRPACMMVNIKQ